MTECSPTEQIIRRLYQVTSDYQKGFDIQILQLIMLGLEEYKLDIGIFSKIVDKQYQIVHCIVPEEIEMSSGDSFDYETTYCELTCRSHKPIAVENAGTSEEFANHPAYKEFKLESYIGVPIYLNDDLYGTLNFSSAEVRKKKFTAIEIDLIYLMGSWIESELLRHKQQTELVLLNEKLEYQANYDALTNIPNRRSLFEILYKQMDNLAYNAGEGSIVVIDIDHFKMVNDNFGHQMGDKVLIKVALCLKNCLADKGFIARFGGEEFVVWLVDMDIQSRRTVINGLMSAIDEITIEGKWLTLSAGVCHFCCETCSNVESKRMIDTLLSLADQALYEAKASGRNREVSYQHVFSDANVINESVSNG